jgi:MFS family permease
MSYKNIDVRKSLSASFKDGAFAAIMSGLTGQYVSPFGLYLGATLQQIGWISSFPNLTGALAQLFSVQAIHRIGGRLRLVVRAVTAQAVFLVCVSLLAAFEFPYRVECLLLLLAFSAFSGGLAEPAWGSLMSDYIPMSKRGRYFGWRNRMLGLVSLVSMMGAGFLLYSIEDLSPALGFLAIFGIAASARFVSASYIARMDEAPQRREPASDFTFWMFVARFRESNFVKFVAFVATLTFAAHMASPYFVVFMLRDLEFSYLTYMALQVVSAGSGLASLPWWGRHADLVGNVRVLRLATLGATVVPLLWLASQNVLYLCVVQVLAGSAWSGVALCASNFIYDAVTPQKRVRCIGYFNVIHGVAIFLGAALGGFLAARLPPLRGHALLTLFVLSSLCRLLVYFSLSRHFHEVRSFREVSMQELFFSVVGIRPLLGIYRE